MVTGCGGFESSELRKGAGVVSPKRNVISLVNLGVMSLEAASAITACGVAVVGAKV